MLDPNLNLDPSPNTGAGPALTISGRDVLRRQGAVFYGTVTERHVMQAPQSTTRNEARSYTIAI